jgi:hypothetical protein
MKYWIIMQSAEFLMVCVCFGAVIGTMIGCSVNEHKRKAGRRKKNTVNPRDGNQAE